MEDYNKIIEALSVRFRNARWTGMLHPVEVVHQHDLENRMIFVNRGQLFFEDTQQEGGLGKKEVKAGQILFVPSGMNLTLTYQGRHEEEARQLSPDDFIKYSDSYFDPLGDDFATLIVDVKAFGSLNFFRSLGITPFVFEDTNVGQVIQQIITEKEQKDMGWERLVQLLSEQVIIFMLRYLRENRLFVEEFTTNLTYFQDPRLIRLFTYIRENLNGDLSNRRLAEVADVSEDYVGQYFKMLTGINPQDYIEYQRMEFAVTLLRTTKNTIRSISQEVGYQDTAYFCRRFKMMFGIPAGKMRKRESMLKEQ